MTDLNKKYRLNTDNDRNIVPVSLKFFLERMRATWVLEPVDGEPPWVLISGGEVIAEFSSLADAMAARKLLFGR